MQSQFTCLAEQLTEQFLMLARAVFSLCGVAADGIIVNLFVSSFRYGFTVRFTVRFSVHKMWLPINANRYFYLNGNVEEKDKE